MAIVVNSAGIYGIDGYKVLVECEISRGLPGFDVVGLPDASVKESRERVKSALKNYAFEYPVSRITINLAPADIKKEGTVYDLPILLAILSRSNQISKINDNMAFVGELSLNGDVRPISGVLSMALSLKDKGVKHFFVPFQNAYEASFCEGISIYAINTIEDVIKHINNEVKLEIFIKPKKENNKNKFELDFADVVGQENVKRALEICAAGMHNVILSGAPGSGKSMMAKRLKGIMPKLTNDELIEVIKIRSVSSFKEDSVSDVRPFRSPHHTVSAIGLTGGIGASKFPRPGEISLAHKGILFLDELPEFSKDAIETLRAPLEDNEITISRVNTSVTYPSEFVLVGAMNPCKCGYYGDDSGKCKCSYESIKRYTSKISGPILDRVDLFVDVKSISFNELSERAKGESSIEILKRVMKAREIQQLRFNNTNIKYNSGITPDKMKEFCSLDEECTLLIERAFNRLGLTARSYDRILKVSRTIADLNENKDIQVGDLAEALQYRK